MNTLKVTLWASDVDEVANHYGFSWCNLFVHDLNSPLHRKPPCMMPFRSYSTWTWWFRSPCGCTHQHHGKTHLFFFHLIPRLTFLSCGLFALILRVLSKVHHIPGVVFFVVVVVLAISVHCYWSRTCIKFSNPCTVPHELLRRQLRSTESPFPREWQSTCPSTSSTTIQNSGQNLRNLTQKGTVLLHPPSLYRCEATPFPSLPLFLIQVYSWGEGKASCSQPHPLWLGS